MPNITISITQECIDLLNSEHARTGLSKSLIVRLALGQYTGAIIADPKTGRIPGVDDEPDNRDRIAAAMARKRAEEYAPEEKRVNRNMVDAVEAWKAAGGPGDSFNAWYATQQALGLLP